MIATFRMSTIDLGWQQTPGWKQGASKTIRSEEVIVDAQGGPLSVGGDHDETALLVNGRITAFHWSDHGGTVGQELVRIAGGDIHAAIHAFRRSVETSCPDTETLATHFSGVAGLLAAGHYCFALEEIPADSYVVELSDAAVDITGFYPGYGAMIATQPVSMLSSSHIDRLAENITQGSRPTVITIAADSGWCEFIIDGHHKISAYRRAGVPILRLNIVRRQCVRLPLQTALEFVPAADGLRAGFMKNRAP
jgi:hypothetical protein